MRSESRRVLLRPADHFLRLSVAAQRLGWTPKTVRRWIADGRIEATKAPNGYWLISEAEVIRCSTSR